MSDRWAILQFSIRAKRHPAKPGETTQGWLERLRQTPGSIRALWEPFCLAALNVPILSADACLFWEVTRQALFGKPQDSAIYFDREGLSRLLNPELGFFLQATGGKLHLSSPAECLEYDEEKRRVISMKMKGGNQKTFDHFVLAVPWAAAANLLPAGDRATTLAKSLLPCPILGVHLWTDRPLAPDLITGFLDSPLHWLFDRTSTLPTGSTGHLYAAVISAVGERIDDSGKQLVELILAEIHRLIPQSRQSRVTHHVVYKSRDATFSGKPGTPLSRPGSETSVENLFLAGDWTETGLPATIEGAVVSGFNAARTAG
jgi:hypothetical protein